MYMRKCYLSMKWSSRQKDGKGELLVLNGINSESTFLKNSQSTHPCKMIQNCHALISTLICKGLDSMRHKNHQLWKAE